MTKEKLVSLKSYIDKLNDKLKAPVPSKHEEHPETYHNYLKNEIRMTKLKIDAALLEGAGK